MGERTAEINPFEDGTAIRALLGLPVFEEALSRLLHLAEHGRPCGIVRGPVGSGKSPLLECARDELRRGGFQCGSMDLRRTTADEFAWCLACELGTAPSSVDHHRCWQLIEDALCGRALSSRVTVLVIDHLGEHDADILKELNRLLAIVDASAGWCTVLGAARSECREIDRFVQENSELRIELGPLPAEETAAFRRRVVETTGCCPFSAEAAAAIHASSQGMLRDVMSLCRLALLARTAEEAPCVTEEIARLVAGEVTTQPVRQRLHDDPAHLVAVD